MPPPVLVALVVAPVWTCRRPGARGLLLVTLAGAAAGLGAKRARATCASPADGAAVSFSGRFLAAAADRTAPFAPEGRCGAVIRVVAGGATAAPAAPVRLTGVWREGAHGGWLLARSVEPLEDAVGRSPRWTAVRWRAHLVERLDVLYGERAPLVAALVLARREGLEPTLREAFARSGTAHLLAISGFHVGVFGALALAVLRVAGAPRRRAELAAGLFCWLYVGFIGFPDAAARAALMISLVAVSRAGGRPPARFGALGTALLAFLVLEPTRLESVGFQLSFAGAFGLVAWAPATRAALLRAAGGRCPGGLASVLAAGVAATGATLPIVAWHFERVSLVGIPATLAASPIVSLALPAALATLVLDFVHAPTARFVAGGVDVLLLLLTGIVEGLAGPEWASVWVPRTAVVAGCTGAAVAWRAAGSTRIRARVRRGLALAGAVGAVGAWPVASALVGWGTVELTVLDVGQGDAVLIRSPRGRWVLVDAGPPARGDGAAGPVASALRRRGVARLEALVITHPHLDHFGEAPWILERLDVRVVFDPALATGEAAHLALLSAARERSVPWRRAAAGDAWEVDGVRFEVLHPAPEDVVPGVDPNDVSIVVRVSYGAFDALLTGDAPASVERELTSRSGGLEVLKVGHHGSGTSTDSSFVWASAPELALVSSGRGNRYGHPDPGVVARLGRAGVEVRRTDREGWIRVRGRRDGRYVVDSERSPSRSAARH